jgi:hypothetical protein
VELVDEGQNNLNFGAVRVKHNATISVSIVNRSKRPAVVDLSRSIKSLAAHNITYSPNKEDVQLKPKEILPVQFSFEPKSRLGQFSEEFLVAVEGMVQPLLFVNGSGHGIEFKLESDILAFGSVVQHGVSSQRIKLRNVGDVGSNFSWDVKQFSPDFTISPSEGYLSPGMDVSIKITFSPTQISSDVRYKNLVCTVDGQTNPLLLTLAGSCVSQTENETLVFKVRRSYTSSRGTNFSSSNRLP